ncbi:hypothetical protein Sango_1883700 [Sesamum angolense]|uniref:Reverse transcriptase domain-containing protein n=1 Tax=Sesamum angolense TaxID=2727404 RepID=A0AAE2BQK7_9LAMI|nr:hypothetical protein Sango_1883700 [Sesamum angolense]
MICYQVVVTEILVGHIFGCNCLLVFGLWGSFVYHPVASVSSTAVCRSGTRGVPGNDSCDRVMLKPWLQNGRNFFGMSRREGCFVEPLPDTFYQIFLPSNAGQFFLKHAEAAEKDIPARELHEILLLALQWLSGMITQSNPFYPLHHLREIETRVWLLAVESEAQMKTEGEDSLTYPTREPGAGKGSNLIDRTASIITKMDNHMNSDKNDRENSQPHVRTNQTVDSSFSTTAVDKKFESEYTPHNLRDDPQFLDEHSKIDASLSRQLKNKLSPDNTPSEFLLIDAALKLAALSTPSNKVFMSDLDDEVRWVIESYNLPTDNWEENVRRCFYLLVVLESLATILMEGSGRRLCRRIISVVKAANVLGLTFAEAFEKQPIELLQLLSLKAQDSFEEANLLVRTHSIRLPSIAQILAESFLKGLLAAHRGGYMDSQKEEGPAPLLWRFSDFLKWAELCPSDSEIGHALMRLVITGQEIPHACEVELLILSHHFYKLSACLDGVDVLVALAATRVEAYVWEGDFSCLARLITGVGNFHALNFILGILIENGQLDLLLQKYSAAADANSGTAEAVRGFRMAVLTSLKQFNPNDLDAFAMAIISAVFYRYDKDQNEDLLQSMRYYIEAAEVHSSIDAGNNTRRACAQASLVSLQIRMPDTKWLDLSETNARRILVEQSRFQEALIVAEAYGLNQPSEWALVLWEQMLNPELTEQFVAEFVAVLPLQPSMLVELARFYRSEMQARGDQSQFSVWLTGGGLPADWAKYLGRSFRCLLKRTRDFRLKLHLATTATGFDDVIDACNRELDKVRENAGPLILRKGHGASTAVWGLTDATKRSCEYILGETTSTNFLSCRDRSSTPQLEKHLLPISRVVNFNPDSENSPHMEERVWDFIFKYQGYTEKKEFRSWDELVVNVLESFEDLDNERVVTEFNKLHHETTVNAYMERLKELKDQMLIFNKNLDEEFFMMKFISGLKKESKPPYKPLNKNPPPKTVPQTRRFLIEAEVRAKKKKNFCYRCDEPYIPGHGCKYRQVYMLLSDEEARDYNRAEQDEQPTDEEETEGDMVVSLHAMKGKINCKTLKVIGLVGDKEVLKLIDSGSTHCFINEKITRTLGCELECTTNMMIRVADGSKLSSKLICPKFSWEVQGHRFSHPVRLLKLGGYDLVLGCDWLSNYNPVELDFHQLKVTLSQAGKKLVLRALPNESSAKKEENTKVLELLQQYNDVFQEPRSLPPERSIEHCIDLLPKAIPKKQHPYRYAYGQKTEIERIVKEMLDGGIIKPSQSSFASPVLALMSTVFEPYLREFVLVFFDDILVYSKDLGIHLMHLKKVMELLKKHQLYAKKSKCSFAQLKVEYLGHIISWEGVAIDP